MERGPTVPIGTVLVGLNVLLREGLARILSAADFRILASASGIDDPVLSSLPQEQPILLIIDVSDDFDAALAQIVTFKHRYPAGQVAVLAHQHHLTHMVSAFRLGANAYLVKVTTCDTFIKSLELVMLGVTLLPPEILTFISDQQDRSRNGGAVVRTVAQLTTKMTPMTDTRMTAMMMMMVVVMTTVKWSGSRLERTNIYHARSSYTPRLSARQQSILHCLIQGDSNKAIARKLAIAEATVKVHVKAILRRIRVHNRTQAAIWAMSNGPFISAKDDASPALNKLSIEQLPSLDVAQVLSARAQERISIVADAQT